MCRCHGKRVAELSKTLSLDDVKACLVQIGHFQVGIGQEAYQTAPRRASSLGEEGVMDLNLFVRTGSISGPRMVPMASGMSWLHGAGSLALIP